jgi:ubiquinone/menaquinone biosynthesis C-methylase UbiE
LSLLTPDRIYVEELLDAGVGTDDDVAKNLADLRRINRFLGGTRVILNALEQDINGNDSDTISLLDVGTGSADIPSSVVAWCKARGARASVAALDLSERNLRIASTRLGINPEISLLRANALELPFARRSFDYVTASLFLHHFHDEDVVRLLADFARVAKRAVIVNDLLRNLVPYYFMKITGPVLSTSFLTREDGPTSVLRGFTVEDFHRLARAAGLERFKVKRVFPYRLSLIAEVAE